MKTQSNIQNKSVKKLVLNKQSIRVLTQVEGVRMEPTQDCTIWTC